MSMIGSANAAPARPAPVAAAAGGGNGWSVNLGRFASENLARSAASSARSGAGSNAQTEVVRIAQGNSNVFTARVRGLSRAQAEQACQRLRATGNCTLVAPGV